MACGRIGFRPRWRDADFSVRGFICSPTQFSVVEDAVRILFCDFELDCEKEEDFLEVREFLEDVKTFMMKSLVEEEIWIVFYPLTRIVS